jgi:Spondin_N
VYLPPVNVSDQYPFLSGIADISPSPDWFTDFYLFSTYKEESQTFWDSFLILSYPWDAGTDSGQHYTDGDRDTDPPEMITRIEVGNAVNNIFLSPAGDKVIHVAEWECVLHTCPEDEPDCEKADWPPANGCDILRFPQCAETCDPTVETDCEQCKRESSQEGNVYHKNCCLAGREPKNGVCKGENGDTVSGAVSLSKATATAAVVFGLATLL